MKDNANQDIRTGYSVNDVFVPNAASQLARTNHYDFVITQEMVDNYIAKHSSVTVLNLGALIKSNADGTTGTWTQARCVKAPVSIYIAADLSGADALPIALVPSLIWKSGSYDGQVVDGRAFFPSGSASRSATDGVVNIYAQYGFKVASLVGGFNFWTTPQAPVTVLGASGWNGVVRLGAYATDDNGIDLEGATGLHIICGQLVSGVGIDSIVSASAVTSGYDFPVVYADWMSGAMGSSVSYAVPAVGKPGLFQQIQQSVALGTDPILTEYGQVGEVTRYRLVSISKSIGALAPDLITYSGNGKTLEIAVDGTVTKKASTQPGSIAVIRDVDIPWNTGASAPALNYDVTNGQYAATAKLTICQDGEFRQIPKPGSGTGATGWDYGTTGSAYAHFDFGASNHLEWYTWYKYYTSYTSSGATTVRYGTNAKTYLFIDIGKLVEGVVYEVGINICALGSGSCSCVVAGDMGFGLRFWSGLDTDVPSIVYPHKWAESSATTGSPDIKPGFRLNVEATDETATPPAPRYHGLETPSSGKSEPVLARASIHFVKIGSDVYVMSY